MITENPIAAATLRRFEALLSHYVEVLGNLGVLVALDVPGLPRTYLSAGHADADRSIPVRNDHCFQIGSQTKTIVAMTMILLAREGALNLDDVVAKYLDLPIDRRIKIRHLLQNSSGLGEFSAAFSSDRAMFVEYSPRDLVALALPQGQLFEPGECFDYCNTGWVIAAQIIEEVTGRPYGQAVRRLLLEPLGIRDSWFCEPAPVDRMMHGYIVDSESGAPRDMAQKLSWAHGAGDGICSIDDVITLFKALMEKDDAAGLRLSDLTAHVLGPRAKPFFALSFGAEYGLGLERRYWAGEEVWGHPGSTLSYLTSTWIDPRRRVTVATCVTCVADPKATVAELRYPRAQLFAMALNAAYSIQDCAK